MRLIKLHEDPSRLEDKHKEDQLKGQIKPKSTLPMIEEESLAEDPRGISLNLKIILYTLNVGKEGTIKISSLL